MTFSEGKRGLLPRPRGLCHQNTFIVYIVYYCMKGMGVGWESRRDGGVNGRGASGGRGARRSVVGGSSAARVRAAGVRGRGARA